MGYFDKMDWESIRKDVQKGVKEGWAVVKEGAVVAAKKAEELTDEGKKRYKIFELKRKVHKRLYDLGGRVYSLVGSSGRPKNPAADDKVKEFVADIKKIEAQLEKMENQLAQGKKKARKA